MKALTSLVMVSLLALPLAGCLVRTGPSHSHSNASARRGNGNNSCGPAYHWNGYRCEHNGNGRANGHRK